MNCQVPYISSVANIVLPTAVQCASWCPISTDIDGFCGTAQFIHVYGSRGLAFDMVLPLVWLSLLFSMSDSEVCPVVLYHRQSDY